jgi:outer membrane protein assembly factor BamB
MLPSLARAMTLVVAVGVCVGCGTPRWSQFHGDARSQGNLGTNTNTNLVLKWSAPVNVGPTSYASPVVAPDGSIVIGSTNGTLSAVKPDGSGTVWTFDTSGFLGKPTIVSSASVTDNGDVYFISSGSVGAADANPPDYRSVLIHLLPTGALKCSARMAVAQETYPPGRYRFTTAAPKVLETGSEAFVFLSLGRWVLVFDASCQEVTRFELHCTGDLSAGSTLTDFDSLSPYPEDRAGPHLFDRWYDPTNGRNWLTPTIAVANTIGRDALRVPIVVVGINACGVFGLEWQGQPTLKLVLKWMKPALADTWLSSPAISAAGQVVVAMSSGLVWSYDLETGKDNWFFKTNEPVLATPAFYAGVLYVYVTGIHTAFKLDGSPNPLSKVTLPGQSASSAAVAWDRIFVSTELGLHSYLTDLTSSQTGGIGTGGMSSPALDADGTVYIASSAGLEAFRGR